MFSAMRSSNDVDAVVLADVYSFDDAVKVILADVSHLLYVDGFSSYKYGIVEVNANGFPVNK